MFNLVDTIKDWFGVMDDAEDYIENIDQGLASIQTMNKKLKTFADDFKKSAGKLQRTDDPADVLDEYDFSRPGLFGKNILGKISGVRRDMLSLKRSLAKSPPEIKSKVSERLEAAIRIVDESLVSNSRAIYLISQLQNDHRSLSQSVVKGAAVTAAVVLGAVALDRFFDLTSQVESLVDQASRQTTEAANALQSAKTTLDLARNAAEKVLDQADDSGLGLGGPGGPAIVLR